MSTEHEPAQPDAAPAPPENATTSAPSETGSQPHASPAASPQHTSPAGEASGGAHAAEGSSAAGGENAAENAGDHDAGDHEDGEEHAEGEGTATAEGAPADGTAPKKRRRRRRRKKGAHAEGGAPLAEGAEGPAPQGQAEGAPAQGQSEGGQHPHPPRREKRKHHHHKEDRERPAFNVGDVVFGKVLEFSEDALFIDLSGKGTALFDLRELLITDDEAQEHERAHAEDEAEARRDRDTSKPAIVEGAEAIADADAKEEGAPPTVPSAGAMQLGDAASTETTEKRAARIVTAPPREEPVVEATPAEATPAEGTSEGETDASLETSPSAKSVPPMEAAQPVEGDSKEPTLPRVILEPGAPFVGVVHNDGGRGGLVVLTHHPKRVSKSKPFVSAAFREGKPIQGLVTGVIKGGIEVDVDGVRAFVPASHMDLRLGADLHTYVGKRLPFAVTQYGKRGRDVVLSRRAQLEVEAKEKRGEALSKLEIGAIVPGIVRTVVAFGAFIDVGGVEGLVPLSEMSHNRGDGPKDVFKVGETLDVKIVKVDDKGKLWLSRRLAIPDPWLEVPQKYAPGSKHTAKVARLQPFGAFIELEPGIDGLIHTGDLSVKRIDHPSEVLKVGDPIDVVVASLDVDKHKIGLHPAPTGDAANEIPQRVAPHKVVKVAVVTVEQVGLVVRVLGATGRHARGFITAGATGTPRGTELRKLFPIGKELEAKIIEIDPRRGELKLSIKAVNEDNERNAYQQYRAQVKREAKFGTLADLLKEKLGKTDQK